MHRNDTDQHWIVVPLVGGGKRQIWKHAEWLQQYWARWVHRVSSCYTLHLITCLKYPRINQKTFF